MTNTILKHNNTILHASMIHCCLSMTAKNYHMHELFAILLWIFKLQVMKSVPPCGLGSCRI